MEMKNILIAIPARYGSSRLEGKPLLQINGKEMLLRVYENAQKVSQYCEHSEVNIDIVVGTEDQRILDFCKKYDIKGFITSESCRTGTDRVKEVLKLTNKNYDLVVNLQGDNPLSPPWHIAALVDAYIRDTTVSVITPCVQLTWSQLDRLRHNKLTTPFSGTTAIIHPASQNAIWFSKQIIPAIRKEETLRADSELSPIYRHIGLYAYTPEVLLHISELDESDYESGNIEGLEQLRFILNGYTVRCALVDYGEYEEIASASGVDNPEDIFRVEKLLHKYGEY